MRKIFCGFVLLVLAVTLQAAEPESMANTFNCYADYLKRHGVLETQFQSEPYNGESRFCEIVLSATVDEVYKNLLEQFKKNDQLRDSAECIVENLRKAKWSDLDIKEQVIVFSESMTVEEKEKKIREIKITQGQVSSSAILSCAAEKEFGELFEQVFNKDVEEGDAATDFCARSYAIDNKLIDSQVYKIDPNPKKIDTKGIKCDGIIKKNFEEAEKELRQHLLKDIGENVKQADCLIKKYHDNHYFNKTLAVELLSELKISDEQKKVEKKKFIESMTKITMSLAECQWILC